MAVLVNVQRTHAVVGVDADYAQAHHRRRGGID